MHSLALLLLVAGAWAQPPRATPPLTQAARGRTLFEARCVACHGPDGKGSAATAKDAGAYSPQALDLTKESLQSLDDGALGRRITAGHGKMKGFGAKLSATEVSQLVAYIRLIGHARAGNAAGGARSGA